MKIGILAGEASGDNLGAGLMTELNNAGQGVSFVGVGGPRMQAQGLQTLASMEELSVNGFRDPIVKLPRLIGLLRLLIREIERADVDAFVGVDFNVFNLLLEKSLKRRGIKTAHYVSPSVYAWRRGRTAAIAKSADLLLCLYPFEPAFYEGLSVHAAFVGHPLADAIQPGDGDSAARGRARAALSIDRDARVLALLPGSRRSEVDLLLEDFLEAANLLARAGPLVVVIPCVNTARHEQIRAALNDARLGPNVEVLLHEGDARMPLIACDIALIKSGTSTLEAMLLNRPMVVSYRLGRLSYQLARRLVRTPYVALPNILAGRVIVPELLQDAASPSALAENLRRELDKSLQEPDYLARFSELSASLRKGADGQAARAVRRLVFEDRARTPN